jgi:hypothetical protein
VESVFINVYHTGHDVTGQCKYISIKITVSQMIQGCYKGRDNKGT